MDSAAAWEYRRGGYSAVVNGTWFAESRVARVGLAQPDRRHRLRDYAKYSASLSRDFYFNVFHKVHLNGAWFGGRDLDRFAKYQFGMFDDTRIHGVPASGARFEELAMVRGSYSFNIFEQYRLDLFLEQAWGRDPALDAAWQPITGIGVAVNLRAPWSTILRVDVGKSFLPERYQGDRLGHAADHVAEAAPMTRMRTLRADLHVHTCHSLESGNLRFLKSRDCYSRPQDVYRVAKARGMDLVDDHRPRLDRRLPRAARSQSRGATDFFIGEEVSCRLPQGDVEVHLGVYGMTERLHRELQPLRRERVRGHRAAARGRGVLRRSIICSTSTGVSFRSMPISGFSTRCRRSKCETAPWCPRTTRSSSGSRADGRARPGSPWSAAATRTRCGGSRAHGRKRPG